MIAPVGAKIFIVYQEMCCNSFTSTPSSHIVCGIDELIILGTLSKNIRLKMSDGLAVGYYHN